jgi:hypothetical protein
MAAYMKWQARMALFEKVIYSMIMISGLIEADRKQYEPEVQRLGSCWDWCESNCAIPARTFRGGLYYSLTSVRECIRNFKTAMVKDLCHANLESNLVNTFADVFEKMTKQWKNIGFDLIQYTHALFGVTGTSSATNTANFMQAQTKLLRLKRQLHSSHPITLKAMDDLSSVSAEVIRWTRKSDSDEDLYFSLPAHEIGVMRLGGVIHLVRLLRELRYQSHFLLQHTECTQFSTLSDVDA